MTYYIATNIDGDYLGDGDTIPFCSDSCRTEYALDHEWAENYYLDSDGADVSEWCAACGVIITGSEDDTCECQRDNIVINRFMSENGDICEHGNYIQLPATDVGRIYP